MLINWLRSNVYASFILLLARLYIGWEWITSGWGKITGEFNATKYLQNAVSKPVVSHGEVVYPTYHAFLENFALPNADMFSFMVAWGEFLAGIGLILGCLTIAAGFFGTFMNFAFLFAGTISSNPWMIIITLFILIGGRNSGYFGLDRWVMPYIESCFKRKKAE